MNRISLFIMNIRIIIKALLLTGFIISSSCMKKEIPVSLSIELIDKGVKMNSFTTDESVVEVYLVSEEAIEGELLSKAMNASGLEISRAKVTLALQKDDAKLFTFNFDANLDLDQVTKYQIDLRKK
ncbi:MAG: hypothetical protein CMI24_06990 [Opitutae bacterium]|nr:hypothetical protein [Opitutae bacterium]